VDVLGKWKSVFQKIKSVLAIFVVLDASKQSKAEIEAQAEASMPIK